MGDITDAIYGDAKRACQDFEIKNLNKYQDLYVQSNMHYLSKYVSQNIRAPSCSFSFFTRISTTSSLKKDQSKIRFIN